MPASTPATGSAQRSRRARIPTTPAALAAHVATASAPESSRNHAGGAWMYPAAKAFAVAFGSKPTLAESPPNSTWVA